MTRPHALVLTPRLPWPLDDGGRVALWQSVWAVAREWTTTLVSIVPAGEERAPLPPEFAAIGVEVVRVPHAPPPAPVAALRGTFGRWPYMLARYRSEACDAAIRRLVAERRPALAMVNHLHMATYLDALGGTPAVLRAHNLEHHWLERWAGRQSNPLVRAYAHHQVARMEAAERELFARCAMVMPMQDGEAEAIRALAPATKVETHAVGVDFARFRARAPQSPPVVSLVGSWDYSPNADGAAVFLARSWPLVRERVPDARLRVVGKHLSPALADAARAVGAEPVGWVADMAEEFARAAVLPVPLWMGSGVRVKIIEGLAAGAPIVATPLGAEGLGLTPGVHFAEGDTPEAIAGAVAALLADPARAEAMATAGREFARAHFSLEATGARMAEACRTVAAGGRA